MKRFAVVAKTWRRVRTRADLDVLSPVLGHYLHAVGGIMLVLGGLYMMAPVLIVLALCAMIGGHPRNNA